MNTVIAAIVSLLVGSGAAWGGTVFARRKYGAEIRAIDATTERTTVDTMAVALEHQDTYIKGLEARLDRADREREALRVAMEARAVRAEQAEIRAAQAEQACRQTLNQVQIQLAEMQHQLRVLQEHDPKFSGDDS